MPVAGAEFNRGVFRETDTKVMRDAYLLAVRSLALTHALSENIKTLLAECIMKVFIDEYPSRARVSAANLASRSVGRFVTFYNLHRLDGDMTLH